MKNDELEIGKVYEIRKWVTMSEAEPKEIYAPLIGFNSKMKPVFECNSFYFHVDNVQIVGAINP